MGESQRLRRIHQLIWRPKGFNIVSLSEYEWKMLPNVDKYWNLKKPFSIHSKWIQKTILFSAISHNTQPKLTCAFVDTIEI